MPTGILRFRDNIESIFDFLIALNKTFYAFFSTKTIFWAAPFLEQSYFLKNKMEQKYFLKNKMIAFKNEFIHLKNTNCKNSCLSKRVYGKSPVWLESFSEPCSIFVSVDIQAPWNICGFR